MYTANQWSYKILCIILISVSENSNYDRNQRISILMQKIQEIRKCYQEERLELASIEKRRKKIKRRKKESMCFK